jgi:hypothetical protein
MIRFILPHNLELISRYKRAFSPLRYKKYLLNSGFLDITYSTRDFFTPTDLLWNFVFQENKVINAMKRYNERKNKKS